MRNCREGLRSCCFSASPKDSHLRCIHASAFSFQAYRWEPWPTPPWPEGLRPMLSMGLQQRPPSAHCFPDTRCSMNTVKGDCWASVRSSPANVVPRSSEGGCADRVITRSSWHTMPVCLCSQLNNWLHPLCCFKSELCLEGPESPLCMSSTEDSEMEIHISALLTS